MTTFKFMGPGTMSWSSHEKVQVVPSRPKFSWAIRKVPLTAGRGVQSRHERSVMFWKKYHAQLSATNPNKIPPELQGILLQSQLYDRAQDLVRSVPEADVSSKEGAEKIV